MEEAELFGVAGVLQQWFGLLVGEHGAFGIAALVEDCTLHDECPCQPVLRPFAAVVVRSLGYGGVSGHRQPAFVLGFSPEQGIERPVGTRQSCGIGAVDGHEGIQRSLRLSHHQRVGCSQGLMHLRIPVGAGDDSLKKECCGQGSQYRGDTDKLFHVSKVGKIRSCPYFVPAWCRLFFGSLLDTMYMLPEGVMEVRHVVFTKHVKGEGVRHNGRRGSNGCRRRWLRVGVK